MSIPAPRPEVIMALFDAACMGMSKEAEKHNATTSEGFSAVFTFMLTSIEVALDMGADVSALRSAIEKLWNALPPTDEKSIQ